MNLICTEQPVLTLRIYRKAPIKLLSKVVLMEVQQTPLYSRRSAIELPAALKNRVSFNQIRTVWRYRS